MVASTTLAVMGIAGALGVGIGMKKRAARKKAEALAADPSLTIGPPPTPPMGALEADSRARSSAAATAALLQQGRRPFSAPTAPGAMGAQTAIRRAPMRLAHAGA